jgi:hypothetical protein
MRSTRFIPVAVLALAAACSDTSTPPTSVDGPQFVTTFNDLTAPQGAHYRQGSGEPVCTVTGLIVSCTGTEIGGVGNTDATLLLDVSYTATVRCRNRGGNIVDVKTQTTTAISSDDLTDVRNGTLFVSAVSSSSPTTQSFLDAATCPNGNWTKLLLEGTPDVSSFTYTLTFDGFTQPAISVTGS